MQLINNNEREELWLLKENYIILDEKIYNNSIHKTIKKTFDKIRNALNKKETEILNYANLLLNQNNLDKHDNIISQKINYFEDEEAIETILSKINRISYLTNFENFRWQSGVNHSISDDRKTITAITKKFHQCCVKATEIIPKNGIHRWKVKINS